jgi:hypothetical protein
MFMYLLPGGPKHLLPSSMACRAWNPVAQKMINSCPIFGIKRQGVERFACGAHFHSLVFGLGSVSINRLEIELQYVSEASVFLLSRLAAPSLTCLCLDNINDDGECHFPSLLFYEIANSFFLNCRRIHSFNLCGVDFGDDTNVFTPSIKEGFGRLKELDLVHCDGVRMFIENVPFRGLKELTYDSYAIDDVEEIISFVAMNCPALKRIEILAMLDSSASILKIAKCCRDIESFYIYGRRLRLEKTDVKAIASLPRLNYLNIRAVEMSSEALFALRKCGTLNHLVVGWSEGLIDLLKVIGADLAGLEISGATAEAWLGIHTNCPNLKYLNISGDDLKDEESMVAALNEGLKKRMQRLSKLKVNHESARLGTDWDGYP